MKDLSKYNKVYHLSHTDADGYGCQMVTIDLINKSNIEYHNVDYGDILETVKELTKKMVRGDLLLITDLNLDLDTVNYLDSIKLVKGFDVLVIDHHKTKEEIYSGREWYKLDTTMSATMATYKYFYSNTKIPFWVEVINNADIYKKDTKEDLFKFKFGKMVSSFVSHYICNIKFPLVIESDARFGIIHTLNKAVTQLDPSDNLGNTEDRFFKTFKTELSHILNNLSNDNWKTIRDLDHVVDEYAPIDDIMVAYMVSYMLKDDIIYKMNLRSYNGYRVLYFEKLQNSNLISNILLAHYKDIDFIIVKGNNGIAFRSLNRVDVSEIAAKFGGGGHPNASGCKMFDIEDLLEAI